MIERCASLRPPPPHPFPSLLWALAVFGKIRIGSILIGQIIPGDIENERTNNSRLTATVRPVHSCRVFSLQTEARRCVERSLRL